jgi:hypothetical protein
MNVYKKSALPFLMGSTKTSAMDFAKIRGRESHLWDAIPKTGEPKKLSSS